MRRKDFISSIAATAGVSKRNVESVLDAMVYEITFALVEGDKVTIPNFITFETGVIGKRSAMNPATGEVVTLPECKTVRCKISKKLKDVVNGKVKF